MTYKYKGHRYEFPQEECIGYQCFAPGRYCHTTMTSSGRVATGNYTWGCVNNMFPGCPGANSLTFDPQLAKERKEAGWRLHESSQGGAVPSVRETIDNFVGEHNASAERSRGNSKI